MTRHSPLLVLSAVCAGLAVGCTMPGLDDEPVQPPTPAEAAPQAQLPPVDPNLLRKIEMKMVLIPAGALGAEFRSHQSIETASKDPAVPIAAFYLSKTEVTQEEWTAAMGEIPSEVQGKDLPVTNVSWVDAQRFIAQLNKAKGGPVFRLPTSEEWEYACRAGTKGKVSYQTKESTLSQYAWWGKNSGGQMHPVGRLKPNGWGLFDMLGNVAEWCQNEAEPLEGSVMRPIAGANFDDENLVGQDCSPGGSMGEEGSDAWTGLRLAKTVQPGEKAAPQGTPGKKKGDRKTGTQ